MKSNTKKLIIILYSEEKEKLNYAMGMIATAAALERPTELFFSGKRINHTERHLVICLRNLSKNFESILYAKSSRSLSHNITPE